MIITIRGKLKIGILERIFKVKLLQPAFNKRVDICHVTDL